MCYSSFICTKANGSNVFYTVYNLHKRAGSDNAEGDESTDPGEYSSPWSTIGAILRTFKGAIDWEEAMWERSFVNLSMMMAALPVYSPAKGKKEDEEIEEIETKDLKDLFGS